MEAIAKQSEPVGYVPAMLTIAAMLIATGGNVAVVAVAAALGVVLAACAVWIASDPRA